VAARSKASFCGRSLVCIAGSNPPESMDFSCSAFVVCFQVQVSATGRSLVQRNLTVCVCVCVCACLCVCMRVYVSH
jgi:hypothetical protein